MKWPRSGSPSRLGSVCSDILSTNSISHPKKDRLQSRRDRTASAWTATVLIACALKINTGETECRQGETRTWCSEQTWTLITTSHALCFSNWSFRSKKRNIKKIASVQNWQNFYFHSPPRVQYIIIWTFVVHLHIEACFNSNIKSNF